MDDVGKVSTNIDDYAYAELLLLLNLDEEQAKDTDEIFNATEKFILKYQKLKGIASKFFLTYGMP